ncbi:MAG: hypothetical protein CL524_08085 [Aequorivita sp.]|nr:hypothetical protein [Aequorivita sp.]
MAALPKEVQYNKPMASLPVDTTMTNVNVRPSNGATFTAGGNIIQFDLPAHSFLVPSSLTLRGLFNIDPDANTNKIYVRGIPAASWIQRVETIVGGSLLESVNDYGRLYNMIGQTKIDYATKAGLQTELALGGGGANGLSAQDPTFTNLNGRRGPTSSSTDGTDATAGEFPFALPLGCLLASCSELIPLGHMGGVRIQLTTAQLSDYITAFLANDTAVAALPEVAFSQLELNFDLVDFGGGMDSVVRSMADANGDLVLKSQGWNATNVNFPQVGAGGTTADYIYNVRLSSIKSLVLQATGEAGHNAHNAGYDAVRGAGKTGSTQFFIANKPFPPTPLRESNAAAVMSSLRQAFGEAHDVYSSNIAIPQKQWVDTANLSNADATASTIFEPASHFVGVNTEKLSTNSVMMSGSSSQLTPISVRLETSEATTADATLTLFACYDALISLNVVSRQVAVRI